MLGLLLSSTMYHVRMRIQGGRASVEAGPSSRLLRATKRNMNMYGPHLSPFHSIPCAKAPPHPADVQRSTAPDACALDSYSALAAASACDSFFFREHAWHIFH